ncbi:MAG: F0F1 ATP synthase subunit B [Oscillospiraceae bacterium]|nr:F0F1 ATP synthase subunit B [Oscillospiraceae bacterium]
MAFFTGFESFIGVNFWTCLFTLCNLIILTVVMKKLLFKPVKKMIDSRQQEIDDMYASANESKESARQLRAEYEGKLAQTEAESEKILRESYRKAQLREEEILRQAQDKAAQTLKRADEQTQMAKKRAMNEIKDEVSVMAVDIAAAVLARDIQAGEHTQMIDSFIKHLGEQDD